MAIYKKVDMILKDGYVSSMYFQNDCYGKFISLNTNSGSIMIGIDELKALVSELESWDAKAEEPDSF